MIKKWLDEINKEKIIKNMILYILRTIVKPLFVIAFIFGIMFAILPKESIIFYEGEAVDISHFKVKDNNPLAFTFNSGENYAVVTMENENKSDIFSKNIFMINAKEADKIDISSIDEHTFNRKNILPFIRGNGTVSNNDKFYFYIDLPNNKKLSYDMEIEHIDENFEQVIPAGVMSGANLITISNIPKEATVYLRSEIPIRTPGVSEEFSAAQYKILNCDKIKLYIKESSNSSIDENTLSIERTIKEFNIINDNTGQLEITTMADTEYKDLKHVPIYGKTKSDNLFLKIDDAGSNPLRICLSGGVKKLTVAEHSCYVNVRQWIIDNMTEILLAFLTIIFTAAIKENHKKKSD